jgi:hypothetical protein
LCDLRTGSGSKTSWRVRALVALVSSSGPREREWVIVVENHISAWLEVKTSVKFTNDNCTLARRSYAPGSLEVLRIDTTTVQRRSITLERLGTPKRPILADMNADRDGSEMVTVIHSVLCCFFFRNKLAHIGTSLRRCRLLSIPVALSDRHRSLNSFREIISLTTTQMRACASSRWGGSAQDAPKCTSNLGSDFGREAR